MKPAIDAKYPPLHFIAFDDGVIVADAKTYAELEMTLVSIGKNSREVFVIQAGVEYPEYAAILFLPRPM